jgi:L-threonylcarbamoyladenylate synthase
VVLEYSHETIDRAAAVIAHGGVIAFRTDTFYGLGANPFNRDAVKRIKELKGREDHKPILIVISDRSQVDRFIANLSPAFDQLAGKFWPGPLTLIGEADSNLPEEITAGTKTVGVRLPDDEEVRALVRACGGALTATSANSSGSAPATDARTVKAYFGDEINLIIDGGAARSELPSTVVDASGAESKLIREGVIPWTTIQKPDR